MEIDLEVDSYRKWVRVFLVIFCKNPVDTCERKLQLKSVFWIIRNLFLQKFGNSLQLLKEYLDAASERSYVFWNVEKWYNIRVNKYL